MPSPCRRSDRASSSVSRPGCRSLRADRSAPATDRRSGRRRTRVSAICAAGPRIAAPCSSNAAWVRLAPRRTQRPGVSSAEALESLADRADAIGEIGHRRAALAGATVPAPAQAATSRAVALSSQLVNLLDGGSGGSPRNNQPTCVLKRAISRLLLVPAGLTAEAGDQVSGVGRSRLFHHAVRGPPTPSRPGTARQRPFAASTKRLGRDRGPPRPPGVG